jgi:hypothetical protein
MVDCNGVRAALLENRPQLGADLEAHAAGCAGCSELLAHNAALGRLLATAERASPRIAEADLASAVARDLERDRGLLGRLRALSTKRRIALAAAVAVLPVFLLAVDNPRALTPGRWVTVAFGVLLVMVTASLLAPLSRVRSEPRLLALAALALALPAIRFLLIASTTAPATNSAWACFAIGVLCSLPAFALLHLIARRPSFSLVEFMLVGGVAGLSANMALQLHCIDKRLDHLLAGHAFIGLLWLGCSWLAVRRAARRVSA